MTTPTGYKFLYNSVETDFADVFDTSIPGTITTGYTSAAYGKDLGQIFTSGSNSGITTNYRYSTNIDLGSIFSLPFLNPWSALGSGVTSQVWAIAIDGNIIYAGGNFGIQKFDTVTSVWSSLDVGVAGTVYSIAINGNSVYVGGQFMNLGNGTLVNNIAMWNSTTSIWSALSTGLTTFQSINAAICYAITIKGTDVYVGGNFQEAGNSIIYYFAKWDSILLSWSSPGASQNTYPGGIVSCIVIRDDKIYVSSSSISLGDRVYVYDLITPSWTYSLVSLLQTFALAIDSLGNIYVGGAGSGYLNPEVYIYKSNISNINNWTAYISSTNLITYSLYNVVYTIAIDSANNVYVGGNFITTTDTTIIPATTTTVNNITEVKFNSNTWNALGVNTLIGTNNPVQTIAINSINDLYVGGTFTQSGGISTNHISKYTFSKPYTITGTVTLTSDGTYNTILTWTSNGSITFDTAFTVYYTLIGSGAGGGNGVSSSGGGNGAGGAGGGNGQQVNSSWPSAINTTYNITVASVSPAGISGSSSSISGVNTAAGGITSAGGAGGNAGSPPQAGGNSTVGGGGGGGGVTVNNIPGGNGGTATSPGGNGGNGGSMYPSGNGIGNPGTPGQNNLGGGGGGGGGGERGGYSGGPGGTGGSGTVVLKFNI